MASHFDVNSTFKQRIDNMNRKMNLFNHEKTVLKNLDLFVLDNSLRENALGSTRGHSIENRWKIYNEVKKCGFRHIAIASFKHMTRSGEEFVKQLQARGENLHDHFAFVEFLDTDEPPAGLLKCKEFGIKNVVLELDLMYRGIDYNVYTGQKIVDILKQRFHWIRQHLSSTSLIFVNIRDFSETMMKHPARVFYLVHMLASMPIAQRIFGLCFEDEGKCYSEQLAVWTSCVKEEMERCGWKGQLLTNIHEQYGLSTTTQMDCLADGATGIWAGLAEEGATMGHVSSTITIMNLIRLGNTKVVAKFKCNRLAEASANVTQYITGQPPHPRQPAVGDRALGVCYEMPHLDANVDLKDSSSITRLSVRSTTKKILAKLQHVFGHTSAHFDHEIAKKMKALMDEDSQITAHSNRDYNSRCGLAMLYERAGGVGTSEMKQAVVLNANHRTTHDKLIQEVRAWWNEWDLRDESQRDDDLDFFAFYNGFMAPYFGNSRSNDTHRLLEQIDFLKDDKVNWNKFKMHLEFAAGEYPNISNTADIINVAFRESLIVSMIEILIEESQQSEKFYSEYQYHQDSFFSALAVQTNVDYPTEELAKAEEYFNEVRTVAKELDDDIICYDIMVKSSSFNSSAQNCSATICIFGEKKSTAMFTLESGITGDKSKVFDTTQKQSFDIIAMDVGKIKKIKVQLICDGPASWGLDWIVVKSASEYMMFKADQVIQQTRDAQNSNYFDRFHTTLQLFAEQKEVPKIPYHVSIKTKNYEGFSADTMSDVHIVIFGDKGNTGAMKFDLEGLNRKKMFDKSSSHAFSFNGKDVGEITNIRVTHSNLEKTATWYLEYVQVKVRTTMVNFQADQWLRKSPYSQQLRVDLFAPRPQGEGTAPTMYEVDLRTAEEGKPGRDAKMTIQLHGKYGNTGHVLLSEGIRNFDNKYSFSDQDIGSIQRISVGHDDIGNDSKWYLEGVSVKDCKYERTLEFSASTWLNANTSCDLYPKLQDNKHHLETYHVITKTGTLPEASTDANVYVVLIGDNGETEHVLLDQDCDYDLFEDDQEDIITVHAPSVGSIHTIKIGHDNEGRSANWYVEGVDVINPSHDESMDFFAEKWLGDAISRRDGGIQSIECELFPVPESEDDNYVAYEIEVKTGDYIGLEENAKVDVCLVGAIYNTGKLPLNHVSGNDAKIFDKSYKHLYSLLGIDIGPLYKIRIMHNNPNGNANWYLDWVVIKTRMYYIKIQVEKWMVKSERTGHLYLDLFPPEDTELKEKYQVTLMTNNFHGFDPDTEVDPVWLCVFGDKGNTGMINWRMPDYDKTEIFDKNNKHYMTFEAPNVGTIKCIRVIHTNYANNAEWKIDYVQVKGDGQNVKFRCKEWLQKTDCDNRLQLDVYAPKPSKAEDVVYKVKTITGSMADADTDACVFINFYGTYGESGKIRLHKDKGKAFQKDAEDLFTVSAIDVGRLYKISISHDNSGNSPNWYLDTVCVDQPHLERSLEFDCRSWLDKSKTDVEKVLYPSIGDNPDNKTTYHMTVKTGDLAHSNTDANVYVQLIGECGFTDDISLDQYAKAGQDPFEQDNEDLFTFDAPDVGPILRVRIGHDNQGKSTDWYVRWISVICPSMTDSLTFHADQWISSRKVGANLEVELTEVINDEIPYDIIVKSSSFSSAATNIQAAICLFGDKKYTAMQTLETPEEDTRKVFDTSSKQQFQLDALDVGPIKKIKVQLACDAPARWGIDWIIVKTRDQFLNFRINEVLEQSRDPQKDEHNFSERYQATLQIFAEIEEEPKIRYYVTIKTTNYAGFSADTLSDVHITLFGDQGNSGRLPFQFAGSRNRKKMFDKQNSHTFDFHARDIGKLTNIRVTHSNNETTAMWFLDYVQVIAKDYDVKFPANQWLRKSPYSDQLRVDLFAAGGNPDEKESIYHVITKTGVLPEASTDANVYVVLKGDNGETEQLLLDQDCDYDLFEDDQEDVITVKAPNVGHIQSIKLGHDNEGRSANWYVEGVDIIHPALEQSVDLIANCWLGDPVSRRDGGTQKVETELISVLEQDDEHEIAYSIELKTKNYTGSKDAKAYICIQGKDTTTGQLELTDSHGGDIFDSSSKQMFCVKGIDIGEVAKIKITCKNPGASAEWFLETAVVKTSMYYQKINVDSSFVKVPSTGSLCVDIVPQKDEYAKIEYKMTVVTANYHGFDPDSDVDPVWLCVFGDKGNTGMINWKCPEDDKTEIFEKTNKHYMTFEAHDVGKISCVRVIHTNYEGDAEWMIDYVQINKGSDSVKFRSKEWLKSTNCDNRLQLDIYGKRGKEAQNDVAIYKLKVKTSSLPESGTQANVYVNFHGAYGDTGNVLLEHADHSRQLFKQGQEDEFTITCSDVGPINKITLGHDNSGENAKWHLDSLDVELPSYGQKMKCSVGRWLDTYTGEALIKLDIVAKVHENPDNKTVYHILTRTGDKPEASTDANVFVQIFGEGGDTGKIMLDLIGGTGDLFEQDNEDVFTVEAADVGPITKIRVGHDNQGDSGNWFVRWLDVIQTSQLYSNTFHADFWLADDMDDKQLQRDIMAEPSIEVIIPYDVAIKTTSFKSSASNVSASICIFGNKRSTAMVELSDFGDTNKVFGSDKLNHFSFDAFEVGDVRKIKLQLITDGPTSWGVDHVIVKFKSEYLTFKINQVIEQKREIKEGQFANRRYISTLQVYAEKKEVPQIPYQVTVKTKNYEGFNSSTPSNVHIVLFGEKGNSGRLSFGSNVNKKLFDKNSSHTFNLQAPDVGKITNIRVLHSNEETTAKWFLDYVKVKANGYDINFQANKWLRKATYSNQLRIDLFAPRPIGQADESVVYEVRIKTGDLEEADTSREVTLQLHGKYGKTKPIALDEKTTKNSVLFRRGMENSFTIYEKNIGPIQRINLGHDDGGHGGKWFVDTVTVNAPAQALVFPAHKWVESDTASDFFPSVAANCDHLESYHVVTKTGTLPEASTDANVYVVLIGDNGETGPVILDNDPGYDVFEDDQEDILTVRAPNVGHIHSIKIGHDNTGRSANWYCEGIDVIHPSYDESLDFNAGCWLGGNNERRDGGDQTVEKELFSIDEADVEGLITYSIEIKTGNYEGSLDANAKICILGETASTGLLDLVHPTGSNAQIFNRSGRNLFTLEGVDVGPLYKIKIVHDNPGGECKWFIDYVVVKTKMYYEKINIQQWVDKNPSTGSLILNVVPRVEDDAKITYNVTVMTGNYHGFNPDADIDPVWLCIFGEKGDTGMVNWNQPDYDKVEIFDKNNKHYMTMNARDVGKITAVRVIHTNDAGSAEWMLDFVRIKTDDQDVKFRSKKWMDKTPCNLRLQTDLYAPSMGGTEMIRYKVKVHTGDILDADTNANVHVNFHGTHGETGNIALKGENAWPAFRRAGVDEFMVYGADVGRLYKVSIGHDDSTRVARWFVHAVHVEAPQYEQKLHFTPDRWLDSAGADKKIEVELFPKALENPDNMTCYHLTIKTGDIPDASTDANVWMILHGAEGNTGRIEMDAYSQKEDLFEQDNEDMFSVVTADIGPVRKITIGHDDQGESADWYINWVNVVCPSHSYSDIFTMERFLSSERGDKLTHCDVYPNSLKDMKVPYEITFMTANYRGYGESYGSVSIIVFGHNYNTGKMEIKLPNEDKDEIFGKSNKHAYEVQGVDVGGIERIKVIHDNRTGKSEWKLKYIRVKKNDIDIRFSINDWLDLQSGKLEGEFEQK